jgi:hypothetical protein
MLSGIHAESENIFYIFLIYFHFRLLLKVIILMVVVKSMTSYVKIDTNYYFCPKHSIKPCCIDNYVLL